MDSVGIEVTSPHQEIYVSLNSSTEGRRISPTGARYGMAQKKMKVKTLKATQFSKMLGTGIIFKLKKLGAENL